MNSQRLRFGDFEIDPLEATLRRSDVPVKLRPQAFRILFLLASIEGGLLVRHGAHTMGAPDGGPGLFFLNWSTTHGDLRVSHFLGMHGIQMLPILGWVVSRNNRQSGTAVVVIAFVAQLVLFGWTLAEAVSQRALLRM